MPRDLRELLQILDSRGKIYRFEKEINKDTELMPFYRVQMRGLSDSERKVFLFNNVIGAKGKKYEMRVLAGVYGASEEIFTIGMGCKTYVEILEKWHKAVTHPVPPVMVSDGPVQEVVHEGTDIKELGLDEFPVPVEEPGFSGMVRTGLPVISKDPETGVRNVGTYNAFFRGRDRLCAGFGHQINDYHWKKARRKKEGLPAAIVIGCSPEIMVAASADLPYGEDELGVAGSLAGSSIELIPCRTVPLEVPAHAEAIIEGIISTELVEPRLPFGENPGHIHVDQNLRPVMRVTAITHRKDAIFTPVLVGFPPSDCNLIYGFCHSAQMYRRLKYGCQFPVEEVYFPQISGGAKLCLIRMKDGVLNETVRDVLVEAAKVGNAKYIVALDWDIDLRNSELLLWALVFRTQPRDDFTIMEGASGPLDPSTAPTGSGRGKMISGEGRSHSRVLIDATRKWPYPPVALPKKEYMERALELWEEETALPSPLMQSPWYGYTLGQWGEELQRYADFIVRGEYVELGEEIARLQQKVTDQMLSKRLVSTE